MSRQAARECSEVARFVTVQPGKPPHWVVDIAEQLRAYRKQMRYSQIVMASLCNLPVSTYGRLERPEVGYFPALEILTRVTRNTALQFRFLVSDGHVSVIPDM
jgi:DNA-binding XRE family transcriptional regulator